MKPTALSSHAAVRAQQRAIPPLIIQWLLEFGSACPSTAGTEIRYFDRASRQDMSRALGHQIVDRLGALLSAYAVVGADGTLITVGHRHKRLPRH